MEAAARKLDEVVFLAYKESLDEVRSLLRSVSELSITVDQRVISTNLIQVQLDGAMDGIHRLQQQLTEDQQRFQNLGG